MRENRPYGSEGGASQTNGTSLPPIVGEAASGFDQTKVNVAIIAPRDEAISRDCDHFDRASNIFGSLFLCEFGQKINRETQEGETQGTLRQFRFAESVTLMTAEREGAKAFYGARNH